MCFEMLWMGRFCEKHYDEENNSITFPSRALGGLRTLD